MFQSIGRFTAKYRIPLLVGWVAAAILVTVLAPNLDDVATNDQSDFLPKDSPYIVGQQLVEKYFPEQVQDGSLTLVFEADEPGAISTPENTAFIADVSDWLVSADAPEGIGSVQSPTLNPELAAALTSPDQQVSIVAMGLSITDEVRITKAIDAINEKLDSAPASLHTYQTGQSAIFNDYDAVITETVDGTLIVTLTLVIVILLLIYRSPVSPFIPLSVVTVAYLIARGIVAWMGEADVFTVSGTASLLLIVVMYGSGTDFCLFLINRFREELADNSDSQESIRRTVRFVGESITSSAATTTTGFLAMSTAQLGLFNTSGPALAIGIVVSLLAGLTLTPSILGLLGQRAFFPGQAAKRETGIFYKKTSQLVSSRPLLTIIVIVVAMSPFVVYGSQYKASYDTLNDLPDDLNSTEGFRVLERHIGAGNLQPLVAVAQLNDADMMTDVAALTADLEKIDNIAVVRSASQPLGAGIEAPPQLAEAYLNRDAGAARFEIVLSTSPYGVEAMDTALEIRDTLNASSKDAAVIGSAALQADIRDLLAQDIRLTVSLVLVGIFIVLVLMLRSLVAPTYLIGTILLSYGTNLGITRLVSDIFWGSDALIWWVPFFVFVFLVALGIDYSIFLFGRIKEEVQEHGITDGIHQAVQATGSIITSAGIIVAGTFGALMTGNLLGLAQIGFAVSIGILLDTFVVRTILDPALATFFGRWTWWPGNVKIQPREVTARDEGMLPSPGTD